jgi:MFS family permease
MALTKKVRWIEQLLVLLPLRLPTSPAVGAIDAANATPAGFGNVARALANRNYRLYATGNAISLVGTWLQRVAVGWLAWQLSHSGTWLGLVAFADLFPTVVLSPFSGALADRHNRLRVVLGTQIAAMLQAGILAALTALDAISVEGLFVLTLLLGAANGINQPARLALIPSLVDRTQLPSAVAINSVVFNGARFVGPAVAGIVIAEGSIALAFLLNALSYVAFLVALLRLTIAEEEMRPAGRNLLRASLDGYRYAARHPGIGGMLLLMTATSFAVRGYVELLPGFTDTVFHRGAQGLAWLTATTGLGAVVGGIVMARRGRLAGTTALIVANTLLMAFAILGFTATENYWLALPCLFVAGFAMVVSSIGAQTLIQTAVEATMRGRIMALYGMIFRGGPALGALVMGTASDATGLRAPIAAGALLCIGFWLWAKLRESRIAAALERSEPDPA